MEDMPLPQALRVAAIITRIGDRLRGVKDTSALSVTVDEWDDDRVAVKVDRVMLDSPTYRESVGIIVAFVASDGSETTHENTLIGPYSKAGAELVSLLIGGGA